MRKKFKEGLIKDSGKDSADNDASKFIQKRLRGILARKRVEEIRREEQIFLNMAPKSKLKDEKGDPISRMNEEKDHRKLVQKNYMDEYENAKEELKDEIMENEGNDIEDAMLKERRDWI